LRNAIACIVAAVGPEHWGDRWSLLILRDMVFQNRRHFGELMVSQERIASNVPGDRQVNVGDLRVTVHSQDIRSQEN
jgi:hypothetical protein